MTRFQLINVGALLMLFLVLLFKTIGNETYVNWVYWPGSFILALALLSGFTIAQPVTKFTQINLKNLFPVIRRALFFGLLLMVLTDLFITIFERFFRLNEHLIIGDLPGKWINEWYRILEGVLFFLLYRVLILYFHQKTYISKKQEVITGLEANVVNSNLKTLRAELNPHFLYNAMNSIAMTVRIRENSKAVGMIANLNELLRVALTKSDDQLVTLSEELDLLDKYLEIEMIRFGERVEIEMTQMDDIQEVKVPQMILQPIVENAFKHGMTDDMGNQKIKISCYQLDEELVMQVYNTTQSQMRIGKIELGSSGVGLNNVVERLRQLYGTKFKFQLEQKTDGIEFTIQIPLER